jgi:hypothetical protein
MRDPAIIAKEAAAKRERPNKAYKPQPEYPHAGIHVFRGRGDEVIFFSKQEIDFEVQFEPNPEFEPLRGVPRSPFTASVLRSKKGEAVSTGATVTTALAFKQEYYKYTIDVAGAEPLDPHIDLHDD